MDADRFFLFAGILLVALLVLLVGIVLALRGRRGSKEQSPIDDKPAPDWVKNIAGAAGKTLARVGDTVTNAPADALIVVRDPATSEWLVEVNGMRYRSLRDIHDDKAATKVLEALSGLQRFAGSIPIAVSASAPSTAPTALPVEPTAAAQPQPPDQPLKPIGPVLAPSVAAAMGQDDRAPSKSRYPAPPNSILDQIEKVLQRNVMRDPALIDRRIHIGAAQDGSLLIEVDWNTYRSADEVPEPNVRDVIKSSIQEWERAA
jgi:hypothetical protein